MFEKICSHWGIFIPNFLFGGKLHVLIIIENDYLLLDSETPNTIKQSILTFRGVKTKGINLFLEPEVIYTDRFKSYPEIKQGVVKHINTNTVYQWRRTYVRENQSKCCPTLTANMGTGGHNVPLILDDRGIRKLTPRECFNLQRFPSEFSLPKLSNSALYKLAGNAVSLPVVKMITEKLDRIL